MWLSTRSHSHTKVFLLLSQHVFLTSQLALELPELGGLTHKDFG